MLMRGVALCAATVILLGCTADELSLTETELTAPLFAKGGQGDFNLGTHLTGDEEVLGTEPHPSVSLAQGQAIFRVSGDDSEVKFRLIAANIDNVTMAHIHCGRPGEVGPPTMWLYPVIGPSGAPGPNASGPHDGVLAFGTFSPGDVICLEADVGADMPLLDAMRAGLTYVNVHTNDGVAPTNTGPGDFPGGEIRGQLD